MQREAFPGNQLQHVPDQARMKGAGPGAGGDGLLLLAADRARLEGTRGYSVEEFHKNMSEAIKKGICTHENRRHECVCR